MTITQMEYIVAVEKFGSFVTAADKCNVTQPTLSMQIQKLEDELGFKLFDRNHHPIVTTEMGKQIIEQTKNVLFEVNKIYEMISNKKDTMKGVLNIAILPTLAPYVLPKMLTTFMDKYPEIELQIFENTTEQILAQLKEDKIDFGILSTPLHNKDLREMPIYYEPYVAYLASDSKLLSKRSIKPEDIDVANLWTLNDEHCMHFQVLNLCDESNTKKISDKQLQYQTGTVQSLVKMVETNGGVTIIPEMAISDFYEHQLENVRYFNGAEPVREVSMVSNRFFVKNKLAQAFINEIIKNIPEKMLAKKKNRTILDIK